MCNIVCFEQYSVFAIFCMCFLKSLHASLLTGGQHYAVVIVNTLRGSGVRMTCFRTHKVLRLVDWLVYALKSLTDLRDLSEESCVIVWRRSFNLH